MKDFRKLKVWEKAHQLTLAIYAATKNFPKDELYGLVSQMRRAASSIPSNIAEGCGKSGDMDLARYMQIAAGSASELEYQLILARDLCYLDAVLHEQLTNQVTEVKRMLTTLIQTLKADR